VGIKPRHTRSVPGLGEEAVLSPVMLEFPLKLRMGESGTQAKKKRELRGERVVTAGGKKGEIIFLEANGKPGNVRRGSLRSSRGGRIKRERGTKERTGKWGWRMKLHKNRAGRPGGPRVGPDRKISLGTRTGTKAAVTNKGKNSREMRTLGGSGGGCSVKKQEGKTAARFSTTVGTHLGWGGEIKEGKGKE